MQRIRRRASYRFALLSALLIVLPSVGFVIGASQSISFAYHIAIVLGIASLAVAFSIEVLSRETETRAKLLLLERNSSAAEIAELHEKIRELDRLLSSASEENDDFRRSRLLDRIHEVQSSLSGATSKTIPSQLDA